MQNTLLSSPELLLVRYGELALKGGNRKFFERTLARNIRSAAKQVSPVELELHQGRIHVIPERRPMEVARRLRDVFGIKTVSPAWGTENDPEAIVAMAGNLMEQVLPANPDKPVTFRVRSRRAEKRFPLDSGELDRYVAEKILPGPERVKVQLKDPEIELGIEVREKRTWLFHERLAGPGGLPVGTLGRVLCLISGGIDSPVASWMAMKRGCSVGFITFHSYPFIGESAKKKVIDLVRLLGRYQAQSRILIAPFTEVQTAIRDNAPEAYRTVLYRRMMQRIASNLAHKYHYQALVTGDSMGQVASQTLENMTCIAAANTLPMLQPLIGFDKEEIIERAQRIGTFETSIKPEPDCCTVFQPRKPVIRGRLEECLKAEADLDVEGLVQSAVDAAESLTLEPEG
ncbi:MAG: thiamine biosynthesis protein ThiI [Chlamydiales bacterium]|jgi:thiamine biosynthesis protein ThiI